MARIVCCPKCAHAQYRSTTYAGKVTPRCGTCHLPLTVPGVETGDKLRADHIKALPNDAQLCVEILLHGGWWVYQDSLVTGNSYLRHDEREEMVLITHDARMEVLQ